MNHIRDYFSSLDSIWTNWALGSQYGAIGPTYNKYHMAFSGGSHRDDSVDLALVTYLGFVDTVG